MHDNVHSDILLPNNPRLDIRIEFPNFLLVPSVVCSLKDGAKDHLNLHFSFK
jgi:hypothetical protein